MNPHAKPDEDDSDLGPAMRRLTEKQQRFVIAYLEQPTQNGSAAARAAGYQSKSGGIRVEAFRQLRNERVLAALREEVDKRFRSDTVIARSVLLEIALDKEHPQRLKAATALLDRGGFGSISEQRISVTHTDMSGPAMLERIRALALELNLDPARLIGSNAAAPPALEVDYTEVEPAEVDPELPL